MSRTQTIKKVDLLRTVSKASFVADMMVNYSRLHQYSSLLVEEGVLTMLLVLIDAHPLPEMLTMAMEIFSNLSLNRKNRREIASCGIANRLNVRHHHHIAVYAYWQTN